MSFPLSNMKKTARLHKEITMAYSRVLKLYLNINVEISYFCMCHIFTYL